MFHTYATHNSYGTNNIKDKENRYSSVRNRQREMKKEKKRICEIVDFLRSGKKIK